MKFSIPGLPGVYYDTDAERTAISTTLTLAGRRAPKPHGYAAQLLPLLWSIDVDLREVPPDHPLQYLHPEGARSLEELPRDARIKVVARDADFALRFAGEVNQQTETAISELVSEVNEGVEAAIERVVGRKEPGEEVVIEIETDDSRADRGGDVRAEETALAIESKSEPDASDERTIEIDSGREAEPDESDGSERDDSRAPDEPDVDRDDAGGGGPEFGEGLDDLEDESDESDDSRESES